MSNSDRFKQFIADWLSETEDVDAVRVVSVQEETMNGGYCPTCSYDYTVLNIRYVDSGGDEQTIVVNTSFAELFGE